MTAPAEHASRGGEALAAAVTEDDWGDLTSVVSDLADLVGDLARLVRDTVPERDALEAQQRVKDADAISRDLAKLINGRIDRALSAEAAP